MPVPCWSRRPGRHPKHRGPYARSFCVSAPAVAIRSQRWPSPASWPVLCWHLLTKEADYQWARPALVANKVRAMELQAGQPTRKGNKRGPAYAYNVKQLRDHEIEVARQAEHVYEQFVSGWQPRRSGKRRTGAANEERR